MSSVGIRHQLLLDPPVLAERSIVGPDGVIGHAGNAIPSSEPLLLSRRLNTYGARE